MRDYRDDDQTVGYCPKCGRTLSGLTVDLEGYCDVHGYQWANWDAIPAGPLMDPSKDEERA